MFKGMLTALLLIGSVSFGSQTVNGIPKGLVKANTGVAEYIKCKFMNYSIAFLLAPRKEDEYGVISISSRDSRQAGDILLHGNFDYDRESVLADRKEVKTSSAWGETKFKISYVGNKIKLEADGAYRINETTSISQNCMYTYGKWDNLFHHFE